MQHTSLQSLLYLLIYATYVIAISLISTYLCNIRHCNLSYIYLFMQHTSLQSLLYLLIYATYVIAISLISTYLCNIRHCNLSYIYLFMQHTSLQWNLSNPTHQGTMVRLYRMSEYSGFISVNRTTLGP
jgi:hypothetical protein